MRLVNIYKQAFVLLSFMTGVSTIHAQEWTIQQCIDTAQQNNKNLQISENHVLIGQQREKEAKANLYPKISANADYKYFSNLPYQLLPLSALNPTAPEGVYREAQFGVPHNINSNLQLTMPLYNSQVYGAIQISKIASEITDLQLQKTEEQIYFEITNLYYNAQVLYYQISFLDSNLVNAERLLKNMELLKQQLLAKGSDVNKVKLQVEQLITQKETVKSKYTQVLNALKFTMGISLDRTIEITSKIEQGKAIEYARFSTLDMQLVSTQKKLLTNEFNNLNKSRFLPSLNLIATYGTTGFGYNGKPSSFLDFYPIGFAGLQLSYPLFNGTVVLKRLAQKRIELENNELQFNLVSEQNSMQVANSNLQRLIAQKSIETVSNQITLAQLIYTQTLQQQQQGTASLTDVLLADNALRESQQLYITALVDYLKADLELKKVTGNISSIK
jgi:outer membrane protein TolC